MGKLSSFVSGLFRSKKNRSVTSTSSKKKSSGSRRPKSSGNLLSERDRRKEITVAPETLPERPATTLECYQKPEDSFVIVHGPSETESPRPTTPVKTGISSPSTPVRVHTPVRLQTSVRVQTPVKQQQPAANSEVDASTTNDDGHSETRYTTTTTAATTVDDDHDIFCENDASELATQHVICRDCKIALEDSNLLQGTKPPERGVESKFRRYAEIDELEMSAGQGCHICSLFLGALNGSTDPVVTGKKDEVFFAVLRQSLEGEFVIVLETAGNIGSMSGGTSTTSGRKLTSTTRRSSRNLEFPRKLGEVVLVRQAADGPKGNTIRPFGEDEEETKENTPFMFTSKTKQIFENAQLSKELNSSASFGLAAEWIRQCRENHEGCSGCRKNGQTQFLPGRLVDVGLNADSDPKLIETAKLEYRVKKHVEYVTLSHMWYDSDLRIQLYSKNLSAFQQGIPVQELSQALQDAIAITRRLRFQYIWIPSLCVIRDSVSDISAIIPTTADIYANSALDIAALTTVSSDSSFFDDRTRNPLAFRSLPLPNTRWSIIPSPPLSPDLCIPSLLDGVEVRSPLPLHSQPEILQQRILSPRTLYFSSFGLAWECITCSATESLPHGTHLPTSQKTSFHTALQSASQERIYNLWSILRETYTRSLLPTTTTTTPTPTSLLPISGLISRISCTTSWSPLHGLWSSPSNPDLLLRDLLWTVPDPQPHPENANDTPSWSYLSVSGTISSLIPILDARPNPLTSQAHLTSSPTATTITLSAPLRPVRCTPNWHLNPFLDSGKPAKKFEEVDWMLDEVPEEDKVGQVLGCLVVMGTEDEGGRRGEWWGIVVEKVEEAEDQSEEKWRRVGVWRQVWGEGTRLEVGGMFGSRGVGDLGLEGWRRDVIII